MNIRKLKLRYVAGYSRKHIRALNDMMQQIFAVASGRALESQSKIWDLMTPTKLQIARARVVRGKLVLGPRDGRIKGKKIRFKMGFGRATSARRRSPSRSPSASSSRRPSTRGAP